MRMLLSSLFVSLTLVGCGGHVQTSISETSSLTLNFPKSRLIPNETQSFTVELTWQGKLIQRAHFDRTVTTYSFNNLPRNVWLSISANQGSGEGSEVLASASKELTLEPGSNQVSDLELVEGLPRDLVAITDFRQAAGEGVPNGNIEFGTDGELFIMKPNPRSGGSWFVKRPLGVARDIDVEFQFLVTQPGGLNGGGDGFAVVLQAVSPFVTGVQGAGLGYEGLSKCIAIEFDMFRNDRLAATPDYGDENNSHVAIMCNGTNPATANHRTSLFSRQVAVGGFRQPLLSTFAGVRSARVRLKNGMLQVFLDQNLSVTQSPIISISQTDLPGGSLRAALGNSTSYFIGVSASTDNAWALTSILGRPKFGTPTQYFRISAWN